MRLPPPCIAWVKSQFLNSAASLRTFLLLCPHGKIRNNINNNNNINTSTNPLCIAWVEGYSLNSVATLITFLLLFPHGNVHNDINKNNNINVSPPPPYVWLGLKILPNVRD